MQTLVAEAKALARQQRFDEAIAALNEALELNPNAEDAKALMIAIRTGAEPRASAGLASSPKVTATNDAVVGPPLSAGEAWTAKAEARALGWTAAHRAKLSALVESLSPSAADLDARGCGESSMPGETLGANLARKRREARESKLYREDVRCIAQQTGYECAVDFGLRGTPDESDFTVSVLFQVREDGSWSKSKVACYLGGAAPGFPRPDE